ncbi:Light-harvesting protein B-800/850 beta 1 chain B6 [Magnetospirillum molischianum DSM 120]|uniref:Light-harvesting protein B-800/850 beta 1 chain B6 n=1 Tax=Magnetospirillum molischianum DSM 120 TaxID=1150626 RepID=H8FQ24_MAGML|nr:Light-harvesting protein B-800/850 beta 1 chain B6 [Magnetospirillum molischianum DSM 120]
MPEILTLADMENGEALALRANPGLWGQVPRCKAMIGSICALLYEAVGEGADNQKNNLRPRLDRPSNISP